MRFLKYGDVFERLIGGGALAHPALLEFNDKNAHNESFVLRRSYAAQIGNDAPIKQFLIRHTAIAEQQPVDSRAKTKSKLNQDNGFVQDMQEGLQRSVRAVN